MKKTLALFLSFCLLLGFTPALAEESLAGTYVLDASALGMPLQVYLIIDESNNFRWTNKLEGGADKGAGMIGGEDGTYMMLYSDSSADSMKTATFTVEGQKLVFSTRVPYGSSSFAPQTDDPENPAYPVAKKLVYEDVLGLYVGSYESEIPAMGITLTYACELELKIGAEYVLTSRYTVMGEPQEYVQTGSFLLEDGRITLDSEGLEGQAGTYADGVMELNAALSAQSKEPKAITLQKAVTADAAGVYTGVKDMSMMGFVANATLTLDAVGGYTYVSQIEGEEDFTDNGSFTVADGGITLLSAAEGATPVEGTLGNDVLTVKMRINANVPMATEITFYSDRIQGEFSAVSQDDGAAPVSSTLTLNRDGTYAISVNDGAYTEEGTFSVFASPMGTSITLTSAAGVESTGVVSNTINITHNVDAAFNTKGFVYAK